MCEQNSHAVIAVWLNTFQRSHVGIGRNMSAGVEV